MTTPFADEFRRILKPGMHFPEEFELLFDWMEKNKLVIRNKYGSTGVLYSERLLKNGWTKTERPGGTIVEFTANGNESLKYWFRSEDPKLLKRLCVFAQTGAEGSQAAFWLDDDGKQVIVHLGSGSGSVLACVLAENPVDFLRLLAIGYDEICWDEDFSRPPNVRKDSEQVFVHPNKEFRLWVAKTFKVNIPKTALEIVKHPAHMGNKRSADPFCKWLSRVCKW